MENTSKIYVAGHTGMVGSAIVRRLAGDGYDNLVTRTSGELDLTRQEAVADFFAKEKPEYVFLAAARVGGIMANNIYRAQFIYENLMIQNHVIHHAYLNGVKKLLFLGSSCIYPKMAPQPLKEEYLLTSELEYTNEPYAIAKIAGIKMCESYNLQYGTDFISVMPTNLYGPNDNYHLERSHVLPAMIRKIHLGHCLETANWEALRRDLDRRPVEGMDGKAQQEDILDMLRKVGLEVVHTGTEKKVRLNLWGTGSPLREFMHVDDLAGACIHMMQKVDWNRDAAGKATDIHEKNGRCLVRSHINLGTGTDLSIRELAEMVKGTVGFEGEIRWDPSKPDGTPRKLMDVSKMRALGFEPAIGLSEGIRATYEDYLT